MKKLLSLTALFNSIFLFSCRDKECINIDPASIQCNIPPTNQVDSSKKLIIGTWNWLVEGRTLNGDSAKTPCGEKTIKTAEFTADGKLFIYNNSVLAEKYRYSIKRANQYISNVPEDTFGIIVFTDYSTGNFLAANEHFPDVVFFGVCERKLYLQSRVLYHFKGNELWGRL